MEIIRAIVTLFINIFFRVEVKGLENVPLEGGAVLCSNHINELDMFLIGFKLKRYVKYMAKEELFKIPILGFIIKLLGAFPVRRGKGDIGAVKIALKLIKEGNIVGMFPEGTRLGRRKDGNVKVKNGAVMIASKANVPIIPVGIKGEYKLFGKIKVVFGKPYYVNNELTEKNDKDLTHEELNRLSQELIKKIYQLIEES